MWRGRIDPCVGTGMRRFHPNWDGKHLSLTSSWTRKRQAATPPMRQCPAAVPGDPGMQLSEERSLSARPASASLLLFLLITCKCIAGAQNAWDMLSEERSQKQITTGSSGINNILGGGIRCKEVTEIGELFTLYQCLYLIMSRSRSTWLAIE
jgi:hypothetical protein